MLESVRYETNRLVKPVEAFELSHNSTPQGRRASSSLDDQMQFLGAKRTKSQRCAVVDATLPPRAYLCTKLSPTTSVLLSAFQLCRAL